MAIDLPCFQFRDTGSCSFGTRCKYKHVEKIAAPQPVNAPSAEPVPPLGLAHEASVVPEPTQVCLSFTRRTFDASDKSR